MKIVLATQAEYVDPVVENDYIANILREDQMLSEALERLGARVERIAWDDPDYDWSAADQVVIRATWDYYLRLQEYRTWLNTIHAKTRLVNSMSQVIWNMDKAYLLELAGSGVNIPETKHLLRGQEHNLTEIMQATGWEKFVLKPAVSGAGYHTYLFEQVSDDLLQTFEALNAERDMLLQRFQPDVVQTGEITLVMIGGQYTHAVLKKAMKGEFRVQDDFGGTVHVYDPTNEEIAFAEDVIKNIQPIPAFGRVDIIRDVYGHLALQELEIIEPELWFRNHPTSAEQLANLLVNI